MAAKTSSGTNINFRISYKAKQELLNILEHKVKPQLSPEDAKVCNLSYLIKAAILTVWGVDCNDFGKGSE